MIKDVDIAWAAGFIDGEGTIHVTSRTAILRAGQKVPSPLHKLAEIFGAGTVRQYPQTYKGETKYFWVWTVSGNNARNIIQLLLPYLTVKKEQAEQLLKVPVFRTDKQRAGQIFALKNQGHSFDEIGQLLNISRQRVHQIYHAFLDAHLEYDSTLPLFPVIEQKRLVEIMTAKRRNKGRPRKPKYMHHTTWERILKERRESKSSSNWGGQRAGAGRPKKALPVS